MTQRGTFNTFRNILSKEMCKMFLDFGTFIIKYEDEVTEENLHMILNKWDPALGESIKASSKNDKKSKTNEIILPGSGKMNSPKQNYPVSEWENLTDEVKGLVCDKVLTGKKVCCAFPVVDDNKCYDCIGKTTQAKKSKSTNGTVKTTTVESGLDGDLDALTNSKKPSIPTKKPNKNTLDVCQTNEMDIYLTTNETLTNVLFYKTDKSDTLYAFGSISGFEWSDENSPVCLPDDWLSRAKPLPSFRNRSIASYPGVDVDGKYLQDLRKEKDIDTLSETNGKKGLLKHTFGSKIAKETEAKPAPKRSFGLKTESCSTPDTAPKRRFGSKKVNKTSEADTCSVDNL